MRTLKMVAWLCCLGIGLAAIGCGDGDPLKRVSVKGKITVGGSEPFANGRVVFEPTRDSGGKKGKIPPLGGAAMTDDDGNYVLKYNNKEGIQAGDYKVYVTLYMLPDGTPMPDQTGEEHPKSIGELKAVNIVPPEYSNSETTTFSATVPDAGGTFDFDIPALKTVKK